MYIKCYAQVLVCFICIKTHKMKVSVDIQFSPHINQMTLTSSTFFKSSLLGVSLSLDPNKKDSLL